MVALQRVLFVTGLLATLAAAAPVHGQCCHASRAYMMPMQAYRAPNPAVQMMQARMAAVQYTQMMNHHSPRAQSFGQIVSQTRPSGSQAATSSQPASTDVQERRQTETERRQAARERLPRPIEDPERQAASKFELARTLWERGDSPAAREWLAEILYKFPSTQIADRARQTLARL